MGPACGDRCGASLAPGSDSGLASGAQPAGLYGHGRLSTLDGPTAPGIPEAQDLCAPKRTLGGVGVGVMIGAASVFYFLGLRGLPVTVASAAANASVVVTVVLSAVFLHQPLGRAQVAGIALTLLGATLLAVSTS